MRFSGYYHIFFHVLNNVFDILGEKEGEKFLKHIRPEIIQLAKSDRRYWLGKRCKALDAAQDFIFELYLRSNHVAEGRKSYSGVVGLILAWEEKKIILEWYDYMTIQNGKSKKGDTFFRYQLNFCIIFFF